jgi:hypothetical protein
MKMGLDVTVHVSGAVEPLIVRYTDDVDAEGTMVAKYVHPILDAARVARPNSFGDCELLDLGDGVIITDPARIVALEYAAFDWSDD